MIWSSAGPNDDGALALDPPTGAVHWTTPAGVEVTGTFRCGDDGLFFKMAGSEREERTVFDPDAARLQWGERNFRLPPGYFGKPTAMPSTAMPSPAPTALRTSLPPVCRELPGSTWEIRSLDGLPASADRTTGETDGVAPRAPHLIFGEGRGTWTKVGGAKESFGYRCDDTKGLTITLSGKPLKMEREEEGFRFAGAPVRRFTPKPQTP
jgi:hypothetical protein